MYYCTSTALPPHISHSSWLDGPVLCTILYRPRVVVVNWVRKVPLIRQFSQEMRCIAVDLTSEQSRAECFRGIEAHVQEWKRPPRLRRTNERHDWGEDLEAPAPARETLIPEASATGLVFGALMSPLPRSTPPQERSSPDSTARRSVADQDEEENWCVPRIKESMYESQALLLFPEGNCCNGERLAPFKKGAFTSGCSIRPVVTHWRCFGGWNQAFPYARRRGRPGTEAIDVKGGGTTTNGGPNGRPGMEELTLEKEKQLLGAEKILESLADGDYDAGKVCYSTSGGGFFNLSSLTQQKQHSKNKHKFILGVYVVHNCGPSGSFLQSCKPHHDHVSLYIIGKSQN